jgi:ATP-dependent protease ClpP protease subunit
MNKWYEITNKAEAPAAEVFLYDEIGGYGIDASQFINELSQIDTDELTVHINSRGGEVFEGFAIYQALKAHPANVTVHVDALAASIASVIAQAGDRVVMARNAEMMIHDGMTTGMGNAAELTKAVEMLDRVSNNIASVYAERAGGDAAQWRNAMLAETWYSAEEAVAAGLADEVAPATKRTARNSADLRIFNYAGRKFAPPPVVATASSEPTDDGLDAASLIAAIKEAFDV